MAAPTTAGTDLAVRGILARQLRIPADDLTDTSPLGELGLAADEHPQLLSAIGEALDARFPDDFLEGVVTYGDLTDAVRVALGPL